jgi:predicted Zn-dependent protease
MKRRTYANSILAAVMAWTLAILPVAAQTRISMPRNKYAASKDVEIGREYARKVEQQMPMIRDNLVDNYVEEVGRRLVASIPAEFRHREFDYTFEVVNARDINAFALPGGPMFVNRGMIEAARNEGEMAGVMAHEISHVALRHATAQATKQGSIGNQLGVIGLILGGAILGGQSGAQLGALGAQAWMTKYSREYETQADILGSKIMADAGYDPRDLANMFRTIQQQGGSRGPEWLSSHPDPGNRYQSINREAQFYSVANPIKVTREFSRVQERLRSMPRAMSMSEIEQRGGQGTSSPTAGGRYSSRVEQPSYRTRAYSAGSWLRVNVPDNWREFSTGSQVTFAPEGAYGDQGITHGAMLGLSQSNGDLYTAAQDHLNELLQSNSYLRQQSDLQRTTVSGRTAYGATLSGRSPVTGRQETVTILMTQLRSGELFYIAGVAPTDEAGQYSTALRNMVSSLRLN